MNGDVKDHKDLTVWKNAAGLVKRLYEITAGFPQSELYGLTSQIRRAAVSIPTNISEGAARGSRKEYAHFVSIALGSTAELETLVYLSSQLNFLDTIMHDELAQEIKSLIRMLINLRQKLREDI